MYIHLLTLMQASLAIRSSQPISMWREGANERNDEADKSAASQAALPASETLPTSERSGCMPHGQTSHKIKRGFRDTHTQQTMRMLKCVQVGVSVRGCKSLEPSLDACAVSQAFSRQAILTMTIRLTCALPQGT